MDWLKREKGFSKKREIVLMAARLGKSRGDVGDACFNLWEWADDNISEENIDSDGNACITLGSPQCTHSFLDSIAGIEGFTKQLSSPEVDWIRLIEDQVLFVNYARHNGSSAKQRAQAQTRKARERSHTNRDVTQASRSDRDKDVTRLDRRREEEEQQQQISPNPGNARANGVRRTTDSPAAAAGAALNGTKTDQQVLDVLDEFEIAEPERSKLARCPELTAAIVRRVCGSTRGNGGAFGAMVNNLWAKVRKIRAKQRKAETPAANVNGHAHSHGAVHTSNGVFGGLVHPIDPPANGVSRAERSAMLAPAKDALRAATIKQRAPVAAVVQPPPKPTSAPTQADVDRTRTRLEQIKRQAGLASTGALS